MTDNQNRSTENPPPIKQTGPSMSLPLVVATSHSTGSQQSQPVPNLAGHLQNLQPQPEGLNPAAMQRVAQTPPHTQSGNTGSGHPGPQQGTLASQSTQQQQPQPESHQNTDSQNLGNQSTSTPGNSHGNPLPSSQHPQQVSGGVVSIPPSGNPSGNLTTLTAASQHHHSMMGHLYPTSAGSLNTGLVNSSNASPIQPQQPQSGLMGSNPSHSQSQPGQALAPSPQQQQTQHHGPQPGSQNQGMLSSVSMAGNMVRVSMPIQAMQNLHSLGGGAGIGVHQMQPLQQMQQQQQQQHPSQQQQQPQQLQGVPQHIQTVQQMAGIPQIQGLHHMQPVQSIQGLQGVQVLGSVPNIQGQQFLTQQQYLQNQLFPNQFQAQMMTPGINIQSVQNTPKSPAVPMQQQQVEVYTTVFQPIQIQQQHQQQQTAPTHQTAQQTAQQQQHSQPSLQQAQQQQQPPQHPQQQPQQMGAPQQTSVANGGTGITKTSSSVTRSLTHVTPQLAANQQQPQQQQQQQQQQAAQMIGGLAGQKQVLQQQRGGQPVVIGQIGVISNQAAGNQTLPKSPLIGQAGQVISSPTQIRFSGQPTFVMGSNANGNSQIIGGVQQVGSVNQFQAMGNLPQNMSLAQPLFGSQTQGAIFSSPPVYIRAAAPQQPQAQQQQQPQQIMQMGAAARPKDSKTLGAAALQGGTRAIGPGLQTVQLTSGIRMQSQVQLHPVNQAQTRMVRPLKPQKPLSPRAIQPKPIGSSGISVSGTSSIVNSSPSITSTPTATVIPKLGTSKPPTVTKVVNATTTPRINPVESKPCNSIVKNVERGASMVTKVFSSTDTMDDQVPPATTNTKTEVTEEVTFVTAGGEGEEKEAKVQVTSMKSWPDKENVKREHQVMSSQPPLVLGPKNSTLDSLTQYRVPEKKQAIVKPVLTHVIGGFVIQEASEPFPVQRYNNNVEGGPGKQGDSDMEVDKQQISSTDRPQQDLVVGGEARLCCEFCKKLVPANRFKGQKRFCSNICAKRYNVGCTKRVGQYRGNNVYANKKKAASRNKEKEGWGRAEDGGRVGSTPIKREDLQQPALLGVSAGPCEEDVRMQLGRQETSSEAEESESQAASTTTEGGGGSLLQEEEESMSPARSPPELKRVDEMEVSPPGGQSNEATVSPQRHRKPLQRWNVQDVTSFLNSLPGCGVYTDMFSSQEIDGQALMLLKEDHLMNTMNIKLGPALKICASIRQILEEGS